MVMGRLYSYCLAVTVAFSATSGTALAEEGALSGFDCLVEPYMLVDLSSPVEGVIETIMVDRSAVVEPGQALVELASGVERAFVESARAKAKMASAIKAKKVSLEFAERQVKRLRELSRKKLVPENERDEAETNFIVAEAELQSALDDQRLAELDLELAIEKLNQRTIRSPIAGVVVERYKSPGESVKDEPMLKLAQIDPLRVEVIVPAQMLGRIEPGMDAEVQLETPGQETYGARVEVVDLVVDAASGTFGVRLQLPNPEYRIPSGVRCEIRFLDQAAAAESS